MNDNDKSNKIFKLEKEMLIFNLFSSSISMSFALNASQSVNALTFICFDLFLFIIVLQRMRQYFPILTFQIETKRKNSTADEKAKMKIEKINVFSFVC